MLKKRKCSLKEKTLKCVNKDFSLIQGDPRKAEELQNSVIGLTECKKILFLFKNPGKICGLHNKSFHSTVPIPLYRTVA